VSGGRIAYAQVSERRGRRGRPVVVERGITGRGAAKRWRHAGGRQAGPTGLDLAGKALAIGWASSSAGGRTVSEVWLRAGARARRVARASVSSGRVLTSPVLDGSWLTWGDSCARGTSCPSPRLRRRAVRGRHGASASAPALALASVAFDRGHAFALAGAGPAAEVGCGLMLPGESCRVLDLGRPFR
jgi:hypothetical protein